MKIDSVGRMLPSDAGRVVSIQSNGDDLFLLTEFGRVYRLTECGPFVHDPENGTNIINDGRALYRMHEIKVVSEED